MWTKLNSHAAGDALCGKIVAAFIVACIYLRGWSVLLAPVRYSIIIGWFELPSGNSTNWSDEDIFPSSIDCIRSRDKTKQFWPSGVEAVCMLFTQSRNEERVMVRGREASWSWGRVCLSRNISKRKCIIASTVQAILCTCLQVMLPRLWSVVIKSWITKLSTIVYDRALA